MPEKHLKQPELTYIVLVFHLQKTKKELKSLCRPERQILFKDMSSIKLVFNVIWLMVNQKHKDNEIKHLKFPVIQNMMVIRED